MIPYKQFRKLNTKGEHNMQSIQFDYSKLKGKIKEVCGTQDALASKIGLGRVTLSQRLNNQSNFSQDEIARMTQALNISNEDIPIYFFTTIV